MQVNDTGSMPPQDENVRSVLAKEINPKGRSVGIFSRGTRFSEPAVWRRVGSLVAAAIAAWIKCRRPIHPVSSGTDHDDGALTLEGGNLELAALNSFIRLILPKTEHYPMNQIYEAFARLESGQACYRIVLNTDFRLI